MLGVVLWSNNDDNKAVIWCEDHGELAYFNGGDQIPFGDVDLDAGDLVQFELEQERNLRLAKNPRRIEQGAYEGLPDALQAAAEPKPHAEIKPAKRRAFMSADVIPFSAARRRAAELVAV